MVSDVTVTLAGFTNTRRTLLWRFMLNSVLMILAPWQYKDNLNVKKTKEIVIEESDRRMIQLAVVDGTVKLTSELIQKPGNCHRQVDNML